MLKRSLSLLALLLSVLPVAAFAGTVSTRVMTTGGSITVNPGGAVYTSANGTVSKWYTSDLAVSVAPSSGFAVTSVKLNGVEKGAVSSITVPTSSSSQTLAVSFARYKVNVTSSATSTDGTVSPYGTQSVYAGVPVTYSFMPNTGKRVESITITGADATLDHTLPYAGTVKATFTATGNVTVVGAFVTLSANAGSPQTVLLNNGAASATLSGSASVSDGTTYAWTQISGPAVATISGATTAAPTVTFSTAGSYSFKLVATNGTSATATTTVAVSNSATEAALNQCVNCHNGSNVGAGTYEKWSASAHSTKAIICSTCHADATTAHPGSAVSAATCEGCHSSKLSTTTHPTELTASKCLGCHNGHNPADGIIALAPSNHPAVTLYTFEEVGMQMAGGQKVPVQVDPSGKGMPYSPKQTCGTAGCHVKNGVDYTYDKISDHAFHAAQGRNEYVDSATGKFDATKNKPWLQSTAMVGKW